MPVLRSLVACAFAAGVVATLPADEPKPAADGFKPMFNGKNLDGWVNVNCAPETFVAKGAEVITTGTPTGFLRTERQYENFVLEMDWMHVNTKEVGNSGLFVWGDPLPAVGTGYTRGIEVQVLVNLEYRDKKTNAVTATSHGDLFSIWGATCTPDRPHPLGWARCLPNENRAKGGGEWNHYKVTADDGTIKLEVNGKEVSGVSKCNPRKGYLALESEGAECHFKNMRIKELPTTNPKPEECAKVAAGFVSLFNGVDLKGWKAGSGGWEVADGVLKAVGNSTLKTEKKYGPFELVFDWRLPAQTKDGPGRLGIVFAQGTKPVLDLNGLMATNDGEIEWKGETSVYDLKTPVKPGAWARSVVRFDGTKLTITVNGTLIYQGTTKAPRADGPIEFSPDKGLEVMNLFVRELKEKK
jgi:hypothetical protein